MCSQTGVREQGKTLIVVAHGAYAKRSFLKPLIEKSITVVGRLRCDAAIYNVPKVPKKRGRGRPHKYGKNKLSLSRRGSHNKGWIQTTVNLYNKTTSVVYKTFIATYKPAGGAMSVVIVKRSSKTEKMMIVAIKRPVIIMCINS